MSKFITFICLFLTCIRPLAYAGSNTFLDYQNYNHGYCPECQCYPCRCGARQDNYVLPSDDQPAYAPQPYAPPPQGYAPEPYAPPSQAYAPPGYYVPPYTPPPPAAQPPPPPAQNGCATGTCPDKKCGDGSCGNKACDGQPKEKCGAQDTCNPAPICGAQCGIPPCALAAAIILLVGCAAVIISIDHGSAAHQ